MKERELFLDKLRLAATCAVVLLHTITGAMDITEDMSQYPAQWRLFMAGMDLVCWSVPVFLIISGYLFLNPERKISMKKMVTKYCRRILLALFLFGVPYAIVELAVTERGLRPDMLGRGILRVLRGESWSHMWYLYLILFLYLMTPGLKWILARIPRWTVYLVQALLLTVCSLLPFLSRLQGLGWEEHLPEEGIYFFYYMCGYLFVTGRRKNAEIRRPLECLPAPENRLRSRRGKLPPGERLGWCLTALAALLAAVMAWSRLRGRFFLMMAYNYPPTVAMSLLLFAGNILLSARKASERRAVFLEQTGRLCFGIYLVHPVFLNFAYKFLRVTPLSFSVGISLPAFFLGTLLLAAGSVWVLYRIPPLRKYVI